MQLVYIRRDPLSDDRIRHSLYDLRGKRKSLLGELYTRALKKRGKKIIAIGDSGPKLINYYCCAQLKMLIKVGVRR